MLHIACIFVGKTHMEFGIASLSIIPVRATPDNRSEMVTQLLFGEAYQVLLKKNAWHKIKSAYDSYEGWISENQHRKVPERYYRQLVSTKQPVALDIVQSATCKDKTLLIVAGSTLPEYDGLNLRLEEERYTYYGQAVFPDHPFDFSKVIEKVAMKYLHAPYLWGGRTPFGIDCSGFTQIVFKILGIPLPRDARQQAERGHLVDFVQFAREGDLAFFENENGKIAHTGIVLKEQKIIHASGRVRIDKLDHFGIFNTSIQQYTHKLRFIKRMI